MYIFRKILYFLFCGCLVLNCFGCGEAKRSTHQSTLTPTTAAPTEPRINDSFSISEEEMMLLRDKPNETVVKVYRVPSNAFSDGYTIEEIVSKVSDDSYYLLLEPQRTNIFRYMKCKKFVEGVPEEVSPPNEEWYAWKAFLEIAMDPHAFIDDNLVVEHMYFLQMTNNCYFAPNIYYSTDQGDFVLYYDYYEGYTLYLFPAEIYYSIEQKVQNYVRPQIPGGAGGYRFDLWMVWDVAPYQIEPPENFMLRLGLVGRMIE